MGTSKHGNPWFGRALALVGAGMWLGAPAQAQGETGFLRGDGNTDFVVSYSMDSYDKFWVGDNLTSAAGVGEIERETFGLFTAHGLNDDMDVSVNAAYVSSESDGTGGFSDESDLQDMLLQLKWRVAHKPTRNGEFSLLVAPGVKQPMSDYENNDVTAIGDGQTDWRGRVIGHFQTEGGVYASVETGYDRRNGDPSDEVPVNVTVGATMWNALTISPFYSRIESLGGIDIGQGGFPETEEEWERWGASAYWRLNERVGVVASYRTTIDGKNTGDVEGFSGGLVFRL